MMVAATRSLYPWLLLVAAGAVACACTSTVTHRPVPNEAADRSLNGIRYYQSSLYLIAYSDGKGGLTTQLKHLPDPNKKMVALPQADGAKLDLTMKFANGVLTESRATADSAEVPKQIVAAVGKLVPQLLAAGAATRGHVPQAGEVGLPAPYIFKVATKGTQIQFIGASGEAPIYVNVPTVAPKPAPKPEGEES